MHYIALHCITLHYISLHYNTIQYIHANIHTYIHKYINKCIYIYIRNKYIYIHYIISNTHTSALLTEALRVCPDWNLEKNQTTIQTTKSARLQIQEDWYHLATAFCSNCTWQQLQTSSRNSLHPGLWEERPDATNPFCILLGKHPRAIPYHKLHTYHKSSYNI